MDIQMQSSVMVLGFHQDTYPDTLPPLILGGLGVYTFNPEYREKLVEINRKIVEAQREALEAFYSESTLPLRKVSSELIEREIAIAGRTYMPLSLEVFSGVSWSEPFTFVGIDLGAPLCRGRLVNHDGINCSYVDLVEAIELATCFCRCLQMRIAGFEHASVFSFSHSFDKRLIASIDLRI